MQRAFIIRPFGKKTDGARRLQGAGMDDWERGNRWVLRPALSAVIPKVSLVAV